MRTKKLNVYEEQFKWMQQHNKADVIMVDDLGRPVQARYTSPIEKWKDLMAPDGTVEVPDMDYYNSLKTVGDIEKAIDDLKDSGFL